MAGSAIFSHRIQGGIKEMLEMAAPPQLSFQVCLKEILNAQIL